MIKVLIADDEPGVVSSTRAVLQVFGYEVATVSDAADILEALRTERPDILLQDVRMPGLDIVAHLKAIRSDPPLARLPVIMFTANVDAEEIWQRVGADGVVGKPFDPYELKDLIARYVASRKADPED